MKAHGTVYLASTPLYTGTVRLAAGWVHILDGESRLENGNWIALARPVSVQASRISRIEWSRKDGQIAGQLSMVEDAA